jgi:hypothetical protein
MISSVTGPRTWTVPTPCRTSRLTSSARGSPYAYASSVPNADRSDLQTQLTGALPHGLLDLLADRILANKEGIEFTCANDGPQSQLRLAVQRLTNVARLADCLARAISI